MTFYKICSCGKVHSAKRASGFEPVCSCGRNLDSILTLNEEEYQAAIAARSKEPEEDKPEEKQPAEQPDRQTDTIYALQSDEGYIIEIPPEGGIIGREHLGKEYLGYFPSVSREHIEVKPRRMVGVLVKDRSSLGTYINNEKIEPGKTKRLSVNDTIKLSDVNFTLIRREE